MIAGWTKVPTSNYLRWTEGYYYKGPPWAGSSAGEYSQDEARHVYPNDPDLGQHGNSDTMIDLITRGIVVPRLYTRSEEIAWGGPPGAWNGTSLWETDPEKALAQFLANMPAQYRIAQNQATTVAAASLPPPVLSSIQTVMSSQLADQATSTNKGSTIGPALPPASVVVPSAQPPSSSSTIFGIDSKTLMIAAGVALAVYLLTK